MNTTSSIPGLQLQCNTFTGCNRDIAVMNGRIRGTQGSSSSGADNNFYSTRTSSFYLSSSNAITYMYSNSSNHAPYNPPTGMTLYSNSTANTCLSSLCGFIPTYPRGAEALSLYRTMSAELSDLAERYESLRDGDGQESEDVVAAVREQFSDLSEEMGDLSRNAIRNIISDSVVDMALLKEWYRAIVGTCHGVSLQQRQGHTVPVPVAAYQLAEVYSGEGDWTAAREVLSAIPGRFGMDSTDADEYRNYLALQQLRENVAGNWYRQTETEIAELQQVAGHNDGRAAHMAREILCFFHEICYGDEPLLDLDGMEGRNLGRDAINRVSTTADGEITLYPNPAHNTLTVESTSPIREITVYDMTGLAVAVETCHGASLQQVVNTASLPTGIYIVKAVTANSTTTAKFIKN